MRTPRLVPFLIIILTGVLDLRASDGAAGPDQAICGTSAVLSADPLGAGEVGTWSVISGSGVFQDSHSPLTQVSGLSVGENGLRWTVVGGGTPVVDEVVITVYDPAATLASAGPDSVLCLPVDTMQLFALPAIAPAIGSWTSVGIALIDVPTDPFSFVEFPSAGTIQMIWTVFNGTCGQASDTAIISVEECVIGMPERPGDLPVLLTFDAATRTVGLRYVPAGEGLEVLDLNGRSVYRSIVPSGGEARMALPMLAPGSYLARIRPGAPGNVLRFVIEH